MSKNILLFHGQYGIWGEEVHKYLKSNTTDHSEEGFFNWLNELRKARK